MVKEMSVRLEVPEGAASDTCARAVWADGATWLVSDISCGELEALAAPRQCRGKEPSKGTVWTGVHNATRHKSVVRHRADRDPSGLMALFEQQSQLLNVQLWKFACAQDASDLMTDIGKKYATGELEKSALTKYRNERLLALGIPIRGGFQAMYGANHHTTFSNPGMGAFK